MLVTRIEILARLSVVLMAVATLASPALAAENVLTLLPEKTLGFAVVNGLSDISEKLGKHAQELNLPETDLLAMAKASAGVEHGLDDEGTLLLAVISSVDGSENIEDSEALIAVPVSDYEQFVGQFNGDASSEITELKVSGQSMLGAEKSGYALLVPSDSEHRSLLKEVLEKNTGVPSELAALGEWIAENDAAIVALSPGIKLLTEKGILAIKEAKEQFSGMEELGDKADQIIAAFDMYLQMLHVIQAEVHTAADGLRIDEVGNIRLGGRVRFTKTGRAAKLSDALNRSTEDLLAGLPGGPFVGVMGASLSPECGELMAKWSVAMMKKNPALYGMKLSDETEDKYLELTLASMRGFHSLSVMMSPGEEGDTILDGMLGIISTDDGTDYLATYEESVDLFQKLIDESDSDFPFKMEVTKAEIAGVKGLKVAMDMGAMMAAQGGPPEAAQMMKKMFGEDGRLTVCILAVEKTKVLFSYGSDKIIERQIAALQSGEPGLSEEASIKKAKALLPEEAGLVAYLSPRGAVAWFENIATNFVPQNALGEIPEFPETPAIGFSAKLVSGGLETELVVPAELPKVIKEYVESVHQ